MPVGGCAGASGGLNNGDRKSMVHSENVLLSGETMDFVIEFALGVAFFFVLIRIVKHARNRKQHS